MNDGPPRVAVIGPTASGKSAVAFAVARDAGDIELVSIDSMQVYRGMNIGTATPPEGEREVVPHHLIDLVEPDHEFTVAEFQAEYETVLTDIAARDRRAILVGGTGLYHRAVIDGLTLPGEWPEIRARLTDEAGRVGAEVMHARLAEIDPEAAAKMEPTNVRRIVRALEVSEGSGQRFSSFGPGLDSYPASPVAQVGLLWRREELAARIESRVHAMVDAGLLDEVRGLHERGMSKTAAQALGYKELIEHIEGRASFDAAVDRVIVRTRQFAVRQERWFRRDPRVRWVEIEGDPVAQAAPIVRDAFTT